MSETATTIINLLSALTSPKAAVKYISVAVFIVVSWSYFSELAKIFGTPDENIGIVVLLAGVGLGSIVGQIISWIGEWIWKSISSVLDSKRLAEQAVKEKSEDDLRIAKENEAILKKYTKSFGHLDWEQKEKLRELTLRDLTLEFSHLGFKSLLENKYIKVVSQISNKKYLVTLNPILTESTKSTWKKEIEDHVDEYFFEMTPEKHRILELMEDREADDESTIDFDIKSILRPYYSCIRKEAEEENGFWLCFRSHYLDEFSKRTGKEYQDEIWIDKNRIVTPSSNEEGNA